MQEAEPSVMNSRALTIDFRFGQALKRIRGFPWTALPTGRAGYYRIRAD